MNNIYILTFFNIPLGEFYSKSRSYKVFSLKSNYLICKHELAKLIFNISVKRIKKGSTKRIFFVSNSNSYLNISFYGTQSRNKENTTKTTNKHRLNTSGN